MTADCSQSRGREPGRSHGPGPATQRGESQRMPAHFRRWCSRPPTAGTRAVDVLQATDATVHLAHPLGAKGFAYRRVKTMSATPGIWWICCGWASCPRPESPTCMSGSCASCSATARSWLRCGRGGVTGSADCSMSISWWHEVRRVPGTHKVSRHPREASDIPRYAHQAPLIQPTGRAGSPAGSRCCDPGTSHPGC
jgi:hypothetical protein